MGTPPIMQKRVVDPRRIAEVFFQQVKQQIQDLDREVRLVSFLATDDPAARMYARFTKNGCSAVGARFELREVRPLALERELHKANEDREVAGIQIYYPVFGTERDAYLRDVVSLEKDVEGLQSRYRYNLYNNIRFLDKGKRKKSLLPCTPLAIIKILEALEVHRKTPGKSPLAGQKICVINRSEIVGRPLAAMLAHDGGNVLSYDVADCMEFEGTDVRESEVPQEQAIAEADVLITGVPSAGFGPIGPKQIKEGAVVINFSSAPNVATSITRKARLYVPRIGPVTVAMCLRNLVTLCCNFPARRG